MGKKYIKFNKNTGEFTGEYLEVSSKVKLKSSKDYIYIDVTGLFIDMSKMEECRLDVKNNELTYFDVVDKTRKKVKIRGI